MTTIVSLSVAATGIAFVLRRARRRSVSTAAWRRCRRNRYRRRGARSGRTGGRRLGDRRNDRPADQVRQDRRHRRRGPLPHPRSAEGQIQGLGARLWARRLAEGATASPARRQPDRGAGAECGGGGAILSGDLLVFDAQDARPRANSPVGRRNACRQPAGQPSGSTSVKTTGCMSCHALGSPGRARCRRMLGDVQELGRSVAAAHHVRTSSDRR